MTPLCSAIVPSFKRISRCESAITSIVKACDDPENVEICLRLQTDDPASIAHIPTFIKLAPIVRIVIGLRYRGYVDHAKWYNDALDIAHGTWIWLLGDDVVVNRGQSGTGWDTLLRKETPDHIVLPDTNRLGKSTYTDDMECPAIWAPNRSWFKFGVQRFEPQIDADMFRVLRKGGFRTEFIDCNFHHQRDDDEIMKTYHSP